MQKIREQVLLRRDKVYQDNEGEVRKRWHFEDAVSFFSSFYSTLFLQSSCALPLPVIKSVFCLFVILKL